MKGFRDFIMRGNLVELAVAFVVGAAFATVVESFTNVLMSLIGKIGGRPDFNSIHPGGVPIGAFLTALVSFLIVAAVVYFFVVKPYEVVLHQMKKDEQAPVAPTQEDLLTEIRDILKDNSGAEDSKN